MLAPYVADPGNFFVISSDFCHWGSRFHYTYYDSGLPSAMPVTALRSAPKNGVPIHESIARVDKICMEAVETGNHDEWCQVLEKTGNTVCGRHPIGVMMAAVQEWLANDKDEQDDVKGEKTNGKGVFRFVRYERSSLVQRVSDSSVSYCSAYAVF